MPHDETADAPLLLLRDKIAGIDGAATAAAWTADTLRGLVDVVRSQKGVAEERDVCLLGAVKAAFKAAGLSRLAPREAAVAAIQAHLWPKPLPRAEDPAARRKDFLKAVQAGALVDAQELATAHPSVLSARSTSKGYGAMHFAAMAGALPLLDWLAEQGLDAAAPSSPPAGGAAPTPAEVAAEYKRDDAARRLRLLADGHAFLRAAPPATTRRGWRRRRARATARRRRCPRARPGPARRPAVAGQAARSRSRRRAAT